MPDRKPFLVIFSSDLHGNYQQYCRIFEFARKCAAGAVILGGDIAPKDFQNRTVQGQRSFYARTLFPLVSEFNERTRRVNLKCPVYLLLGNDDFKANVSYLKKSQNPVGFVLIHKRRVRLNEDFQLIGYSYVPITPFRFKDWEKPDLNNENEHATRINIRTSGVKSRLDGLYSTNINLNDRRNSIENDVRSLFRHSNPRATILVSHAPPFKTSLDLIHTKHHVGSRALRKIISQLQPYITLHGHIHETVDMSGDFVDTIGQTLCMASGNSHVSNDPYAVVFDLYNPKTAKRILLT